MNWLDTLSAELGARRVPRRERARILAELRDHIECEPGCEERLGDPRELAIGFADELATFRARLSAFQTFGALALVAAALILSQLVIASAGGYPGFANGISPLLFFPALLGMVFAPQVALVAGSLAALRSVRLRHAQRLPAAQIDLIGSRARVGVLAGFVTVGGLVLYLVDFSLRLPGWYIGLVGGLAAVAGAVLYAASRSVSRSRAIVSASLGAAGDVYEDVPVIGWRWLRRRPWRLGAAGSLLVAVAVTVFTAHAERSLQEGLERGVVEGFAAALGFALLGRTVGLVSRGAAGSDGSVPVEAMHRRLSRLASDADRTRAELVLRDGFARGQLTLDEFSVRLSAVHDADTVGQLYDALRGLATGS